MKYYLSIIISALYILSCNNTPEKNLETTVSITGTDTISYTIDTSLVDYFHCGQTDSCAVQADIIYIKYAGSNKTFEDSLHKIIALDTIVSTVKSIKHDFDDALEEYKKDSNMFQPMNWDYSSSFAVEYNKHNIFSFSEATEGYTGGAHGFAHVLYYNLDATTGKKITLDDIFKEGYKEPIRKIGEKHFKEEQEIPANQTVEDAGYFDGFLGEGKKNSFELNDNFLISEDGLFFIYNQYEVCCYAQGMPSLTIPIDDIKHLIKPKGYLGFLLEK